MNAQICRDKYIAIVDDHPVMRHGVATYLSSHGMYRIAGEFARGCDFMESLDKVNIDLLIMDIGLAERSGIEVIKDIRSVSPGLPILVYSVYSEKLYAFRALKAGAQGYVEKSTEPETLLKAVELVLRGKIWLSDECSSLLISRMTANGEHFHSDVELLTDRELEAFQFEGQGMSTKETADRMGLSPKTVETYKHKIKEKLNIANHAELRYRAIEWMISNFNKS